MFKCCVVGFGSIFDCILSSCLSDYNITNSKFKTKTFLVSGIFASLDLNYLQIVCVCYVYVEDEYIYVYKCVETCVCVCVVVEGEGFL